MHSPLKTCPTIFFCSFFGKLFRFRNDDTMSRIISGFFFQIILCASCVSEKCILWFLRREICHDKRVILWMLSRMTYLLFWFFLMNFSGKEKVFRDKLFWIIEDSGEIDWKNVSDNKTHLLVPCKCEFKRKSFWPLVLKKFRHPQVFREISWNTQVH